MNQVLRRTGKIKLTGAQSRIVANPGLTSRDIGGFDRLGGQEAVAADSESIKVTN
jgi:hypothetical protein